MILVNKLDKGSSELGKVTVDEIGQLLTGEDCLLLKDAYISPGIDDLCLDIPQGCVTKKICIIMEKTRRAYNLSIAGTLNIHHLCRLSTKKHNKTILLLALLLSCKRKTCHHGKHTYYYILQKTHQCYSVLRNFSSHPSRSNTQSLKRGSIMIYVVLIFELMNSSMASALLASVAWSRRSV